MNNKQTLIDRDYSDWGIVQEGILGNINTYGTTLDYSDIRLEDFFVDTSSNRTDNSRQFTMWTGVLGAEMFNQALRQEIRNYARQ